MRSKAIVLIGLFCLICVSAFAQDAKPVVELHGYMQNRIYSAPGTNTQFKMERASLSAAAAFPDSSKAYVEVYYQPWAPATSGGDTYLESAYYDRPVGDGRIRVGKGRLLTFGMTPAYPNRRTSNYGIVAETFTQDRIQGLQYYIQKDKLDAGLSMYQAYRLGTRQVGDVSGDFGRQGVANNTVPHLTFRDPLGLSMSSKIWTSGRIGGKWDNGLKAGVSATLGTLDPGDITSLTTSSATNSLTPGGTPALVTAPADDDVTVLGLDASYKTKNNIVLQGEYYDGDISNLDVKAWDLLAGYEPPQGWKYYVRYSKKTIGGAPSDNPLSWDLNQTSISIVQPLAKSTWLQYEYEINGENPPAGTSSVSDNLFFVELFTGF